jgi:two-component system response regulator RegA
MVEGDPAAVSPRALLIVEDDEVFRLRLADAMACRGFEVSTAACVKEATEVAQEAHPGFAVVDLVLPDGSGLEVVPILRQIRGDMRIIILSGYGNAATAVGAIKVGALDYLSKPADADDIERALVAGARPVPPAPGTPLSGDEIRWEHAHGVFEQSEGSVTETARRLKIHRRILQRIFAKRSATE